MSNQIVNVDEFISILLSIKAQGYDKVILQEELSETGKVFYNVCPIKEMIYKSYKPNEEDIKLN